MGALRRYENLLAARRRSQRDDAGPFGWLAAATMRRIDGNFKFTVAANSGILAAAAAGWLTPVASSVLHNGSTIAILLNALRGGLASQAKNAQEAKNAARARRAKPAAPAAG